MGHVNNANYLTHVEIARVAYYEHITHNMLPIRTHCADAGISSPRSG
jgi:acyl-CoA thioesterase FadM